MTYHDRWGRLGKGCCDGILWGREFLRNSLKDGCRSAPRRKRCGVWSTIAVDTACELRGHGLLSREGDMGIEQSPRNLPIYTLDCAFLPPMRPTCVNLSVLGESPCAISTHRRGNGVRTHLTSTEWTGEIN